MKTIYVIAFVFGFAVTGLADDVQLAAPLADVLKLSQAHISSDVIQSFINSSTIASNLSLDQILYLRQHGLSDDLISTILKHDADLRQRDSAASVPIPQTPAGNVPVAPDAQPVDPSFGDYPPSAPVEVAPDAVPVPSDDYYWGPGYWGWGGADHVWIGPGWRHRGASGGLHGIDGGFHNGSGAGFHSGSSRGGSHVDGGDFHSGGRGRSSGGGGGGGGGGFHAGSGSGGGFHAGSGGFHGSSAGAGFHGGGGGGGHGR